MVIAFWTTLAAVAAGAVVERRRRRGRPATTPDAQQHKDTLAHTEASTHMRSRSIL